MRAAVNGTVPRMNGLVHEAECECPVCGSPLPMDRYQIIIGERAAHDAEIRRQAEAQFASREATARREATAAANAASASKVAEAVEARKTAEQAVKDAKATFETALRERLETATEAAAKARVEAVNAVTEKFFGENLRLQERVLELQRMLDKKQPQERGSAAELDIAEALQSQFPDCQTTRIPPGKNGPDVAFRVFNNGGFVGTIVVESKSVRRWSNAWVPKLRQDMIEFGASHAILCTSIFPPNETQVAVKDGVVIVSPGRLLAIVEILRRAVITFHTLRLTQQEADEKASKLYRYLVSDKVADRWERIGQATTELRAIEQSDAVWQEKTRTKRLAHVRAVEAARDELHGDIQVIVAGTDDEDLL